MKRKVYGELVRDNYSTVSSISTGFITDYFRGVSIFDYFEEFDLISKLILLIQNWAKVSSEKSST